MLKFFSFLISLVICFTCLTVVTTALAADGSTSLRSPVNTGGPEDWPENEGLSTGNGQQPQSFSPVPQTSANPVPTMSQVLPDNSAQSELATGAQNYQAPQQPVQQTARPDQTILPSGGSNVSGATAGGHIGLPLGNQEEASQPEREIIYVDEKGNPVPKPLDPEKMLVDAHAMMDEGKFDDALMVFQRMREIPNLDPKFLEQALYGISDCQWARYLNNPLAGYEPIVSSTNEALNSNLRSPRVPDALLRLAMANINVGNLSDASGYNVALMRRFPDYPGVAQGFTALGEAQLEKGKNAEAEQSFSIVLDKYPESSQLQDASVGLAKALLNQNKDARANTIMDFISKRWPRYYITDPDFLLKQALNDEKNKRDDDAMSLYWLYVNLDPKRDGNAPLMLKMGDAYSKKGNGDAADFVYSTIEENFPTSPAALTAKIRLAEKGIYDSPVNYDQMSKVFNKTARPTLWQVYNEAIDTSSTQPDAVLAQLKKAMWLYWDKQYTEAMGKAADFIDNNPDHSDVPEARNVLWNAFQKEMNQSLKEHNYGRILLLWNGFPYIRERYGKLDPPLRYALAQGWLERGDEKQSFELMADFLKDPMDANYGEAAFSQFFNHYLKNGSWDKILDLGNLVKNWKMKPELQNQLDYGMALSAQNLNLSAPALAKWKTLANRTDIPLYQQAYATYFLAKDAENRRDLRDAYEGNRKVVELFTRLADERSDKADPERIKEAIAALMDICEVGNRVPEALQWLQRYNTFVGESSPEFPGVRFREARLYRKLGDNNRAQALLEDITTRYPQSPFAQAAASELRTFTVSRDLQHFLPTAPEASEPESKGSTSGNWSSSGPSASANKR